MNTTVQAAKAVGAGCATVALAGVGTGVELYSLLLFLLSLETLL